MKETFYFSHDYNCREDQKIMKLIRVLGMEGYGTYWAIIEILAMNNGSLKLSSIDDIAYQLHIDEKIIKKILFDFNFFLISEDENKFYSERLLKHFEKRDQDKLKKSEAGKKGMAKRWGNNNTVITENNSVITKYNKGKETKAKESKVKEIKLYKKDSFEFNISKKFFDYHIAIGTVSLIYALTNKTEDQILQNWSDDVRKLQKLDKYSEDQIEFIINYVINDDFRIKQIQTIGKLRSKNKYGIPYFVVMIGKAKENQKTLVSKNNGGIARI